MSFAAHAGGPLYVNGAGIPAHWDNTVPIPVNPESGVCAGFSNNQMISKIHDDLDNWAGVDGITLDFDVDETAMPVDVTVDNYQVYLDENAGVNAIAFDDDGQITNALFGTGSSDFVLGFAGFNLPQADDNVITSGQGVFNCSCLENEACSFPVDIEELDHIITHEFGHFIGLDHSQANEALVVAVCDTEVTGDCADVPLMFPTIFDSQEALTLRRDDQVAALTLYGSSGWDESFCTVTGVLLDADGNALECADVQAVTDDTADAIAIVSGALANASDSNTDGDAVDDGECTDNCSAFTLKGLDPAKNYTIRVVPVDPAFIGSSSVGPCKNSQPSGVVQEDIGSISGCAAGSVTDLGDVTTESTAGSSSDGGTDSGGSDAAACGEGQDFSACDELISCSLTSDSRQQGGKNLVLLAAGFYAAVILFRRKQRIKS